MIEDLSYINESNMLRFLANQYAL